MAIATGARRAGCTRDPAPVPRRATGV